MLYIHVANLECARLKYKIHGFEKLQVYQIRLIFFYNYKKVIKFHLNFKNIYVI